MPMMNDDFSRKFLLDVTKDGAVIIRERGQSIRSTGGLPVFSTDTRDEAVQLQVRHCRLANDGSGIYRLSSFSGAVEDLEGVTELFRKTHGENQERAKRSA